MTTVKKVLFISISMLC